MINYIMNNWEIFIIVISIIYGLYQRIQYLCLEKACRFIADVEEYEDLTGEEKFNMVIAWIEKELPVIFRMILLRTLLEKIIQYSYNSSFSYMKNYIKRKTGINVDNLIQKVKEEQ